MNKTIIANRQTIWDIALQRYGTIEGVFQILADNPNAIANLDAALAPGTVLRINDTAIDANILAYYQRNNIAPATGGDETLFTEYNWLLTEDGKPILTESNTPLNLIPGNVTTEDNENLLTESNQNLQF